MEVMRDRAAGFSNSTLGKSGVKSSPGLMNCELLVSVRLGVVKQVGHAMTTKVLESYAVQFPSHSLYGTPASAVTTYVPGVNPVVSKT